MRIFLVMLLLSVGASYAQAQDPGFAAAQQAEQAMQQAQMAGQQAAQFMQQSQLAGQQFAQQAMQASQNAVALQCCAPPAAAPRFSLKSGKYDAPTTVRMTDATRGAIIYYTTDGWTPTPKSHRYTGPITIDSTTTLQAVAIAPYCMRSLVTSAQYTFATPAAAAAPSTTSSVTVPTPAATSGAAANGVASAAASPCVGQNNATIPAANAPGLLLARGTPVPLVFDVKVTSRTAQVGDKILMTLAEDLKVGDVVVAPKGSLAVGNVMQVDKTGAGGAPGDITFKAESLLVHGTVIELCGSALREGQANPPNAALLIPVVGPFTVFKHGKDAVIAAGTTFVASVRADTQIPSAK